MEFYTNNKIYNKIREIIKNDGFEKDFTYHYLFIVSHIRMYRFMNRKFMYEEFVPVKIKYLRKCISHNNAHTFMRILLEAGVIETDNHFIEGRKSKGYKISEHLFDDRFYLINIKDNKLIKKLQNLRRLSIEKVYSEGYGYEHVTKCIEELKIDKHEAVKTVDNLLVEDSYKKSCYLSMIDLFDYKFATVDEKAKRLHNNLTNIAGCLRQHLSFKGKSIEGIDIKNSQPMFLYFILLEEFNVDEKEMNKYLDIVLNKGFYEHFADKLDFVLTAENRKQFKESMFSKVLFDRNRRKLNKYEKAFKEEFPSIHHCVHLKKQLDYKQMAISLQRIESRFIFECVEKIAKEYRIPLFTIHDSISTTEGNAHKIFDIVGEKFIKKYGVKPKLKLEKF